MYAVPVMPPEQDDAAILGFEYSTLAPQTELLLDADIFYSQLFKSSLYYTDNTDYRLTEWLSLTVNGTGTDFFILW